MVWGDASFVAPEKMDFTPDDHLFKGGCRKCFKDSFGGGSAGEGNVEGIVSFDRFFSASQPMFNSVVDGGFSVAGDGEVSSVIPCF